MPSTPPSGEPSVSTASPASDAGPIRFQDLGLAPAILRAVDEVGYEAPSSIQSAAIPPLLAGHDLIGQAQTGTGKTAAFALPLLSRLDPAGPLQILVLTPTRELAIQVAEAMQTYARHLKGFHVLPIYGGQDIGTQLRQLHRGVQAVVGTPGRVQDHLRRGTLKLDQIKALVLDEADEMLRMGFLEEVEAILQHTPADKQVALFSATLPEPIRKVARRYMRNPVEVKIVTKTATVATVTQRYWPVSGVHKLDALTRILEVEDFDAMLIFVRTKVATVELAEKLEARGFACSPLNGDMNQALRERAIERLRKGQLDIVVATDVAARGLDVERISHVVNYDMPNDVESYVHRIGRTGRAGREGVAILFVASREQSALRGIEKATRQEITRMSLPTREDVAGKRIARFKRKVSTVLAEQDLDFLNQVVEEIEREQETSAARVGAALAYLLQKDRPLVPEWPNEAPARPAPAERPYRAATPEGEERATRTPRSDRPIAPGLARYRIEVGSEHGVQPKNIVGALCHEAELEGKQILNLDIRGTYSLVDLPFPFSSATFKKLQKIKISGQEAQLKLFARPEASSAKSAYQRKESPSPYTRPEGGTKPRRKA